MIERSRNQAEANFELGTLNFKLHPHWFSAYLSVTTQLQELEQNHAASDHAYQDIVENCREELTNRKKKTRRRTVMGIIGGVAVGVIAGGVAF